MAVVRVVNPLHYPLAVLAGGVILVAGVRVLRGTPWVMVPVAAVTTLGVAMWRGKQDLVPAVKQPVLDQELRAVQRQAQTLREQAETLRTEAKRVLANSSGVDLLGAVEYACDRTQDLPKNVDNLVYRLAGSDSLLSTREIEQQLAKVSQKQMHSEGMARQQWDKLAASLKRNLALASQGEDARQAQIINLSTLISDAAGVLQQLQTKLRTANLESSTDASELRALSDEFNRYQENVDLLLS